MGLGRYVVWVWALGWFLYHHYHCKHHYCTVYTPKNILPSPNLTQWLSLSQYSKGCELIPLPNRNGNILRVTFSEKIYWECGVMSSQMRSCYALSRGSSRHRIRVWSRSSGVQGRVGWGFSERVTVPTRLSRPVFSDRQRVRRGVRRRSS